MLKVGITGGIGSGKTIVTHFFSLLGIPVYSSDLRAKWLMQEDVDLITAVIYHFGEDIYGQDGKTLNRSLLASRVFNNPEKLSLLNSLVHPVVFKDFDGWCLQQRAPYVLKEAAILFESGSNKDCDYTMLVTAPIELRISRVQRRDNLSVDEIRRRINNQLSDEEKIKLVDFIIHNDEHQLLLPQLLAVHQQLLEKYSLL